MDPRLEELERRTHRVFWSDGLLDLFCAVALLTLGVSWVTEQFVFGAIVPGLLVPFWTPTRARFTQPRLGHVELGNARQQRTRRFTVLLALTGTLSFAMGVGAFLAFEWGLELAPYVVKAIPGAFFGIAGVATAEALQLRRFFVYGGVALAAAVGVAFAPGLNPGWAFVVPGAAALVGGLVLITRFVRDYPIPDPELDA